MSNYRQFSYPKVITIIREQFWQFLRNLSVPYTPTDHAYRSYVDEGIVRIFTTALSVRALQCVSWWSSYHFLFFALRTIAVSQFTAAICGFSCGFYASPYKPNKSDRIFTKAAVLPSLARLFYTRKTLRYTQSIKGHDRRSSSSFASVYVIYSPRVCS